MDKQGIKITSRKQDPCDAYLKRFITHGWGPRCANKDTEDFPELLDEENSRCPACRMWEAYDEFKESLYKQPPTK